MVQGERRNDKAHATRMGRRREKGKDKRDLAKREGIGVEQMKKLIKRTGRWK